MSPTNPIDLCCLPATELAARIRRRDISPVEVVETYLRRIEERNPAINAYTLVLGEQAVEAARAAEAAVMAGQPLGSSPWCAGRDQGPRRCRWRADINGVASGPQSRP